MCQALIARDPDQEEQVQLWLQVTVIQEGGHLGSQAVLGDWPEGRSYAEVLQDGVLLCRSDQTVMSTGWPRLMNVLSPGSVTKINTSGAAFKLMENIVV